MNTKRQFSVKKLFSRPLLSRRTSFHSQATAATESSELTQQTISDKRRIKFAPDDEIFFTLTLNDYTPKEIKSSWFEEKEYLKIKNKVVKQVEKMESKVALNENECSRGLEGMTTIGQATKMKNRFLSFDKVLLEQENQRQSGQIDDEAIADVYRDVSSSCELWARISGFGDQRQANES